MKTRIFIVLFFLSTIASAQIIKLLDFAGTSNGNQPRGSLISDGTFLYGMTYYGGANNMGLVFKVMPDGTGYVDLLDFAGNSNGSYPGGTLYYDGTFLYGMTSHGGINDLGVIFKIKPDGTGFSKLIDFAGISNGSRPYGDLISDGIFLYGMTGGGGSNNFGSIFKIMPNGSGYSDIFDFAGATNGSAPMGSLIYDGTFLYGMTSGGGINNDKGVIFKIKPDGTGYLKLLDFAGISTGQWPQGSLVSDGTFLYGMTWNGGSIAGVIFKIKTDGTGFVKLLDFTGSANGSDPLGSLIFDGTFLYGMTQGGGLNNLGIIFKIKTDGTGFTDLFDFDGSLNGAIPFGNLLFDGISFYGMTNLGGINGDGVIFKFGITTGINENNSTIDLYFFPNPSSSTFNINCTEEIKMILVNDILGNEIYKTEGPNKIIDASSFPQGIYFVTIKTSKGTGVKKVIRE